MKIRTLVAIGMLALLVSCSGNMNKNESDGKDFLASNIDSSILPGTDFFLYANNGWFRQNPIPASEGSNGLWQLIRDTINAQIRDICEKASAEVNAAAGSNKQKIGDLFFSGMDSVSINKAGVSGIRTELDQLGEVKDAASLASACALVHMNSGAPLFDFYVGQDDKNSSKYAIFIRQGGLSLPDRSFYLETDERSLKLRDQYMAYLQNMLRILGRDSITAGITAKEVMQLETKLASASRKIEDTRDPHRNYHKMGVSGLQKSVPTFDWKNFLNGMGLKDPDTVIVGQPEFLSALNKQLGETPMKVWVAYLQLHFLRGLAPILMTIPTLNISGFTTLLCGELPK